MRTLYVVPGLADNGGVRLSLSLAAQLGATGDEARLCVVRPGHDGTVAPGVDGVPIDVLSDTPVRLRRDLPALLGRLGDAARRADVVVSPYGLGEGFSFAWAAARLARRPLVVLVQQDLPPSLPEVLPRDRWIARRLYPRVDGAVCVSPGVLAGSAPLGLSPQRAHVIPNGIDLAAVRAAAAGDVPELDPSGPPVVLGVGRLTALKGFDGLIRASALAHEAGAAHRLVILGEGPERPALEALARRLGIEDSVHLVGHRPDPAAWMARATVFCCSSGIEGFSLATLEALTLGVPVIATDTSGPRSVLAGGAYGALVPVDDLAIFADTLANHLRDPAPLTARAQVGRAAGEPASDIATCAAHHRDYYAHVVATWRSGTIVPPRCCAPAARTARLGAGRLAGAAA